MYVSVWIESREEAYILHVAGTLTCNKNKKVLNHSIDALAPNKTQTNGKRIVVDLTGVTKIDDAGYRAVSYAINRLEEFGANYCFCVNLKSAAFKDHAEKSPLLFGKVEPNIHLALLKVSN
jgi:anti-anti-sigma regulatory factor